MANTHTLRDSMNRRIFIFVLALAVYAAAVPVVRVVTLYQGSSAMLYSNSISRMNWIIENPDDTEASVTLLVKNAGGVANAIFSREISVPAKSTASGFSFVRAGDTGACTVECIHKGRIIEKKEMLVNVKGRHYFSIALLNDADSGGGYGDVQKAVGLPYRALFTTYRSDTVPEYWSALVHYAAIFVLDADLESYSNLQLNALKDYVAMGGVLVIASPEAALKMQGTALEKMLPYVPVNIERDERFMRLAGVFSVKPPAERENYDNNGVPEATPCGRLLNFLPLDNADPILSAKGRAYAVRASWGMGLVIGLAFDPFELVRQDKEYIHPVWSLVMINSEYIPQYMLADDTARVNGMLQMLHGYSIPPVSSVLWILVVYAAVLVVVLAVFIKLRRQAAGWLIACVCAVAAIVFILCRSSGTSENAAEFAVANVSVSPWNQARGASLNNALLLARKDLKPTVKGVDSDVILQPQYPASGSDRGGRMLASQLWEHTDRKGTFLEKLSLQKLRPRAVVWTDSGNGYMENECILPQMKITAEGVRLEDWNIPQDLGDADYAVLSVNGNARKLEIEDGVLHDSGARNLVEADTVLTAAIEYIKVLPIKSPVVVFITSNPEKKPFGLEMSAGSSPASVYDLDMRVVAVTGDGQGIPDIVPPELLNMQIPTDSVMRSMYKNGEWLSVGAASLRGGDYTVMFTVPPKYVSSSPAAVKVWLEAFNPSMSVECIPQLIDDKGRYIDGVRTGNGEYTFTIGERSFVNKYTSSFKVKLNIRSDSASTLSGAGRTDYWQLRSISASIVNKL